jgi:hypothetical protein
MQGRSGDLDVGRLKSDQGGAAGELRIEVRALTMGNVIPLQDQVDELKSALGQTDTIWPFGFTKSEAAIFNLLMKRERVGNESAHAVLYADRSEDRRPEWNNVPVIISRLRAKLRPYEVAIRTVHGDGWYISAVDKQKVHALVELDRSGNGLPKPKREPALEFPVESGIPVPPRMKPLTDRGKYQFSRLNVGQSIFVHGIKGTKLAHCAKSFQRSHPGWKYVARTVDGGARLWRTA